MALWKRVLFWFITFLVLAVPVATILFLCIDSSIKFYPGIARDLGRGWTRPEVEAYLGGPPGDYTTVPYSFDPPEGTEPAEAKAQRDAFLELFSRDGRTRLMWISDAGCVLVSVDRNDRVVSSGEIKIYLSRQPNLLDMLKRRLRLRYVPVAE